jgi:hypothetical protein
MLRGNGKRQRANAVSVPDQGTRISSAMAKEDSTTERVGATRTEEPTGLDPKISHIVRTLREEGIETFESCDGGQGHSFPEPTVRFFGNHAEGYRALTVALNYAMRVQDLRRYWQVIDGEPVGPHWEMTFFFPPDKGGL